MRPEPGEPFRNEVDAYTEGRAEARPIFRAGVEQVRDRLDLELAVVRGELVRVDAKANTLLAVCGLLLGASITVLGAKDRPSVTILIILGMALVAGALVRLLLTVRPQLNDGHGFMRWAATVDGHEVLEELSAAPSDVDLQCANQLHHLSVLLRAKYAAVRGASTLIIAGLGAGAIAATLAVWPR